MARRTRIDVGIYRDAYAIGATVKVGTLQREKRFPLDASRKDIKAWQGDTRAPLRKLKPGAGRGTFAADAEKYLRAVPTLATFKNASSTSTCGSPSSDRGRGTRSRRLTSTACCHAGYLTGCRRQRCGTDARRS